MPNALHDDEMERISDDDLRDITGIDADEEAEIEANAAADNSSFTPQQLSEKEAEPESSSKSEKSAPDDSLESRFSNMFNDAREKDSFYKGKGKGSGSKGILKRKGAIGAAGGAGVVVVVMGAFMFNFLHTFQMDHFFKNNELKTSKRLKSSLDTRNKRLTRAYMEMRVSEFEGNTEGKNLFFKADKVTSGKNPMQNWYSTLRKNKFEEKVFEKNGISFVSMVDADGNISPARIKALDQIDPKLTATYLTNTIDKNGNPVPPLSAESLPKRLSAIPDEDLEKIVAVDKFDSHKAARKAVKSAVDEEIPWYRVFKRRHVRKDVEAVAGIKSWRLFEDKRDKLAKDVQARKDQLYAKMIDTYFSRNPSTANLLKCVFANGSCARTTDVADEDNRVGNAATGDGLNADDQGKDDETRKAASDQKAAENALASDIEGETSDVISKAAEGDINKGLSTETAKKLEGSSVSKRIIYSIIAKTTKQELGEVVEATAPIPEPGKLWTIAKWIAKMDKLFKGGDKSKLSMMVKNAKRAQLIGLFATYSIANDQIKSGQLIGDQLKDFFATSQNLGNSEGWLETSGRSAGDSAADKAKKDAYCKKDPSKREYTEFAWYCDDQNPGNGGNAEKLSKIYESSIGPIAAPIGSVVNGIQENPVVSWVADFIPNLLGKLTEPLTKYALGSDVGKNAQARLAGLMMGAIGMLGGGPMFDGSSPGIANLLVAGGAAQSESSTRLSGGVASTQLTLDYTNQLAAQYDKDQNASESLYDRYASLDNPTSFSANALFAVSSKPIAQQVGSLFTSISSIPAIFGNMLSGKAFAQSSTNASDISDWAGVDKYDIPKQCQDLDPLDPDYLTKSSNVQSKVGLDPNTLGWDVMRNGDEFWKKVYEKTQDETLTGSIYNCALFDSRVMGNIGGLYGYNEDNAYSPDGGGGGTANTGTNGSSASNANLYWVGDSYTVGAKSAGLDTKLQANGWSVTSNGLVSRHMTGEPPSPGGIQQMDLDKSVMANAGAVVVALGTNDIGAGPDAFNASLQTTYDKVKANAPNAKIYWVNYYLKARSVQGKDNEKNTLLSQFAGSHNVTVIDYASIAPPIPYTPDGIHPQNYGPLVDKAVETIGKAPSS